MKESTKWKGPPAKKAKSTGNAASLAAKAARASAAHKSSSTPETINFRQMLEALKPHDHLCLIYESLKEWRYAIIPFIAIGLKRGEKCGYIVDTSTANQVRNYLKKEGIDVGSVEKSGQLFILHQTEAYTREGSFDPDLMIALLKSETEKAVAEGYPALRVTGEMSWALRGHPGSGRILEYEAKLNQYLFPHYPCLAICQYDRWKFDPEIIKGVIMTHPLLVRGQNIYNNFYYIPPEEFLNHKRAETEAQHWLNNIEREQQVQKTLRENEEKYRITFENVNDAIILVNKYGKFTDINKKAEECFGYKREEVLGKHFSKLGVIRLKDLSRMVRLFARAIKESKLTPIPELESKRKDGSRIFIEVNTALIKKDGKIEGTVNVIRDITERKKYEQLLKESEEKYRNVVERGNDGICIILDKIVKYVNPRLAEMWGGSAEEIIETPFTNYIHPDELTKIIDRYSRRMAGEQIPSLYETVLRRKDGSKIAVELNVGITEYEGNLSELVLIRDLTERKKAEEALKYREKLMEKASTIATEFLNIPVEEIDNSINKALKTIGELCAADRSYIFLFSKDGNTADCTNEWCAEGIEPQINTLQNLSRGKMKIIEIMLREGSLNIPDVSRLYSKFSFEKNEFQRQRIQSIINVPMITRGDIIGFIGLNSVKTRRTWTEDIVHFLKITGETFASALKRKEDETALKQSEERYRLLIENAAECISVVQDGIIKFTNPQFSKLTGYSPEELKTVSPTDLIHPDDKKRVMEYHAKRMKGEPVSNSYALRMVDRKGNIKWLDRNITDINWEGKRAALVFDTDITERKVAELAMKESEERFRKIFDESPLGMALSGPDFRFFAVNQKFCQMLGYTQNEFIGTTFADITHPDHIEKDRENIKKLSLREIPYYKTEKRYIKKNKEVLWGFTTVTAIYNDNGDIQYYLAMVDDITERKKMEDELNLRAKLLDGASDSIMLRDFEGNIVYANEKAISSTGYSKEEFRHITVGQLSAVHGKLKGKLLQKLLKEGNVVFEDIILRKDGTSFPVEINSMIIELEGSKLILSVARDVSERKHMEWSLRKNEQRLKEAEKLGKLGNWELEISTHKLEWSDQVYRLYERDKALGAPTPEEEAMYYPPEEAERLHKLLLHAVKTGEKQKYDLTANLPSGRIATFSYTMQPIRNEKGQITRLFGTVQDITERKQAEEARKESEIKYRSLFEDSRDPVYVTSREGNFLEFNQATLDLLGYSKEELMNFSATKIFANPEDRHKFQQAIEDQDSLKDYEIQFRKKDSSIIDCLVSATIWRDKAGSIGGYRGIMHDITYLKKAEEERRKNTEKLLEAMKSTVSAMAKTTEIRDPYTAGHQRRVANLVRAIAKEMNIPESQIEGIYLAGIIHDVGKMYIPADILNRPGKLNKLEFDIVKTHAQAGYDILKDVEFPWNISDAVLNHHERMDGSGYPRGLSGKDLSLEAKILAVADVVEAMASHRPYRPALGIDKALEEIQQNRGKLYDSDVVDACVRLFKEKGFKLE